MKFLRFYPKKNKIISVSIKDKSCNSPEENFMKKRDNGEVAFALISLFRVQVQESCKQVTN